MAEISVNVELLEEKIQKLKDLKTVCDGIDVTTESLSGSGQSIEIIQLVDQEFPLLKSAIGELLTNSISFFENVKNSIIGADTEASAKIE